MKTGYFDTPEVSGFTWRTYWEERNGAVSVTGLQLRSKNFSNVWYPGGTISVNGVPVLTMDFNSPATHSFSIWQVGDTFVPIQVQSGASLPVSSERITGSCAKITVAVTLYRDSGSPRPTLTGSAEIPLTAGLVRIQTANGAKRHRAYIKRGGKIVPAAAVVKHGGKIKYCT